MANKKRYIKLQLKYGSKFNQLNLTHPSIIKIANSVNNVYKHGDRYIVGTDPTDEFLAATTNDIATYDSTIKEWVFSTPYIGQEVIDLNQRSLLKFNGTEWSNVLAFRYEPGEPVGDAETAVKLRTARNFSMTGGAYASNVSFDGTDNVTFDVSYLDVSYVKGGILSTEYGGTGNDENKTAGLITPLNIKILGSIAGSTVSPVDFTDGEDVEIKISHIDADNIDQGILSTAHGGTGSETVSGMLKGITNSQGINKIVTADANKDYTTPSGSITGNAATADKFKKKKTIKLLNDVTGVVSTDFDDGTNVEITTSYTGTLPINKGGTGKTTVDEARNALNASVIGHHHLVAEIDDFPETMKAKGGRADTADRWTVVRTLNVNSAATGSVVMDGSTDVTLSLNNLDASQLTKGIVPTARLNGTYPINITGNAASSTKSEYATTAGNASSAASSSYATTANYATTAGTATKATSVTYPCAYNGIANYSYAKGTWYKVPYSGFITWGTGNAGDDGNFYYYIANSSMTTLICHNNTVCNECGAFSNCYPIVAGMYFKYTGGHFDYMTVTYIW